MAQPTTPNALPARLRSSASLPPGLLTTLDTLAARCRVAGTCLMFVLPDKSIGFEDPLAGEFFTRFVLPRLRNSSGLNADLSEQASRVTVASTVSVCEPISEVRVAILPMVERRQLNGVLLLIAKSDQVATGSTELVTCDGEAAAFATAVAGVPAHTAESITRHGRLLLTTVRDQLRLAGLEHDLAELSGQLANTYEELSLIYQISGGMRVNRRPAAFFRQACMDAIGVLDVRGIGVALLHATELQVPPVLYGPLALPSEDVARLGTQLLSTLARSKTTLLVNEIAKDSRFNWLHGSAHRLLATPIQRGDEVLGCLFALDKSDDEFDSADSKLLHSIANESAIYLENAVLFEDVHGLMMGLMHSLTSAVDAKDTYTCGHSVRVATISKLIAQHAKLDESLVERVYMAGLLHDVGKIGVPESILQKPGRLTDDEFEQMKRHPAIGAHILTDIKQVQDLIPGVLHHHERFDGRGYPNRLAGREIPLFGRIICLADCFDAMTSTRTYRKSMPLEVALADIRRCSGTQFDPALAEAFLQIPSAQLAEALRPTDTMNLRLATVDRTAEFSPSRSREQAA